MSLPAEGTIMSFEGTAERRSATTLRAAPGCISSILDCARPAVTRKVDVLNACAKSLALWSSSGVFTNACDAHVWLVKTKGLSKPQPGSKTAAARPQKL